MKRFLIFACLVLIAVPGFSTTYYARNGVAGNWASNTSWDTVSSAGAGPAGPPVAGDTAIFDSGFDTGNITIAATAACTTLTVEAGSTGTLTWGTFTLTVSGNVTFASGFHLVGVSGTLLINETSTLTSDGLTLPGNLSFTLSKTITLAGDLNVAGTLTSSAGTLTFAGAYDITCGTFVFAGTNISGSTVILVSGKTLTISTSIIAAGGGFYLSTIRAVTPTSATNIVYNGTAETCKVAGITFTDIAYSGGTVTNLDNWHGGTLLRTTGITNRTSLDVGGGGDSFISLLRDSRIPNSTVFLFGIVLTGGLIVRLRNK